MARKLIAVGLAAAGVGALSLALTDRARTLSIGAAVFFLLLAAILLSNSRALALPLRELVGKPVVVTAWGTPLPTSASQLVVASVSSFGAGLLIRLQTGECAELLKVAQPRSASYNSGTLLVPQAAYVQWAGKRLVRQAGQDALVLRAAA